MADTISIDCPICFEEYNKKLFAPQLMPCGHTICCRCMDILIAMDSDMETKLATVACPFDLKSFTEVQLSYMPKNFAILDLLEKRDDLRSKNDEVEKTTETPDEALKELTVEEPTESPPSNQDIDFEDVQKIGKTVLACQQHSAEFTHFDGECKELVCEQCLQGVHLDHMCMTIHEVASLCKVEIKDFIVRASLRTKEVERLQVEHKKGKEDLHQKYKRADAKITVEFEKVC